MDSEKLPSLTNSKVRKIREKVKRRKLSSAKMSCTLTPPTQTRDPEQFLMAKLPEVAGLVHKKQHDKMKVSLCLEVLFKKATDSQDTVVIFSSTTVLPGDGEVKDAFLDILERTEDFKRRGWMIKEVKQLDVLLTSQTQLSLHA
jgi:hypothetical protein